VDASLIDVITLQVQGAVKNEEGAARFKISHSQNTNGHYSNLLFGSARVGTFKTWTNPSSGIGNLESWFSFVSTLFGSSSAFS
jgi:hypothetical protein